MKAFLIQDDALDNPKLMLLPAETFRFWFQCMCVANKMTPRGTLPAAAPLAFRTRRTEAEIATLMGELVAAGLVEKSRGQWSIHDWEHYQKAERDWAAIKRGQRGKKPAAAGPPDPPSNGMSTPCPRGHGVDIHSESPHVSAHKGIKEGISQQAGCLSSHQDCVETALESFGDKAANSVAKQRDRLDAELSGRWDCLDAALHEVRRRLKLRNAKPIDDVVGYAVPIAQEYAVAGIPPEPAPVGPPAAKPSEADRTFRSDATTDIPFKPFKRAAK